MTPLPALSDVIRETLTDEVRGRTERAWQDCYDESGSAVASYRAWLDVILSALLLPLTEREQGLQEERDKARADCQFMVDKAASNNLQHYREQGNETLAQIERAEAAEARVSALTAEREALWTLAREAANGWACYAKRKIELDDIHRIHQALQALAGAPHAPTQEKA